MLERFVAGRDVRCPGCGYSLRDLKADRCPECGDRIELRVNLSDPRLGLFIACVIGPAVGLGFHATIILWYGVVHLFGGYHLGLRVLSVPIVSTFVLAAGMGYLLKHRNPFRRLGWPAKLAWAVFSWSCTAVSATLFFLLT